ncbi:hypothetical protein CDD81_1080 [Ophiocordyceps australis]|uniref:ubiquitinyl hydrolase 1 n=1 Tax=Ophiocordyceps australis TaxID=1399860 RepID=A0A2C5XUE4_9HYPO|nr:hypothetical protein CDD81_1080 [Ophiocordyceps australis]
MMAPRRTPRFFLGQLRQVRWKLLSEDWKRAIVAKTDLLKELANPGHTNWDPLEFPESLLLEVESNLMIRSNQEDIASIMRAPPRNGNAVMQLNMGEGKSAVIVPIVAAHLADGKKLVRVIVAKPQAKELHRILVAKLSGLLNHQIYQMPISRSVDPSASEIESIWDMCRECMRNGGVLLVQPEHILSFQLMAIERQLVKDNTKGSIQLDMQQFFTSYTRDVVDESDENFSVKFEVVYTIGDQVPVEFSPFRWVLIQRLLTFVACAAPLVKQELPQSIEVASCEAGRFPRTRILRQDGLELLLKLVAQDLTNVGLPGFPLSRWSAAVRGQILEYISRADLSLEQIVAVEDQSGFMTPTTQDAMLLLRGLLAGGLLEFVLTKKRWRVNYGPARDRYPLTRLAVPYRAKDDPAPRSEFGHTDAVILFTCLSYYYQGLSDAELVLAFGHLRQSDQAEEEYHGALIFPHLKQAKSVVDYFLSHLVFAKEMREFANKLSASGWDIGQEKKHPTTGFSSTNDSKQLLPLDVKHLDLDGQKHTNALVLHHLLQPENDVTRIPHSDEGVCQALLGVMHDLNRPVQVLLDVGAQILELTNLEVAKAWLNSVADDEKEAVVFFNDADELCVLDRLGQVQALHTSPYEQQLDVCLVFLDEAHTRGTDLKLPTHYRAAVTLGANLTKDKLIQACMRMRKLGKGQSVVFCVSDEIHGKICAAINKPRGTAISVSDVLLWSICETHADIRRGLPLWAMQGARFERQRAIWADVARGEGMEMSATDAGRFLEQERQTLAERYQPSRKGQRCGLVLEAPLDAASRDRISQINQRCASFKIVDYATSALEEEQERELAPEVEKEKQIERPPAAKPRRHQIDPALGRFIATGRLPTSFSVFIPAFRALANTSIAAHLNLNVLPHTLRVTRDFVQTVELCSSPCADLYLRPVQYILSTTNASGTVQNLVIISPHEAQELLPNLEQDTRVTLHIYSPLS